MPKSSSAMDTPRSWAACTVASAAFGSAMIAVSVISRHSWAGTSVEPDRTAVRSARKAGSLSWAAETFTDMIAGTSAWGSHRSA